MPQYKMNAVELKNVLWFLFVKILSTAAILIVDQVNLLRLPLSAVSQLQPIKQLSIIALTELK